MAAITTAAYPEPRAQRPGGTPTPSQSSEQLTVSPPRTRVFPYFIKITATSRSSFATDVLRGPVILLGYTNAVDAVGDPPAGSMELGWKPVPGGETSVPLTTPRPYTLLTELQDPQDGVLGTAGGGFLHNTPQSPLMGSYVPVRIVIDAPEICVVIAEVNSAGFVMKASGYLHVIENVSQETLRFFQ